jgi:hypothetical protein
VVERADTFVRNRFIGHNDATLAGTFRSVQRGVGASEQHSGALVAVMAGYTDAYPDPDPSTADIKLLRNEFDGATRCESCCLLGRIDGQNCELVTAKARHNVT